MNTDVAWVVETLSFCACNSNALTPLTVHSLPGSPGFVKTKTMGAEGSGVPLAFTVAETAYKQELTVPIPPPMLSNLQSSGGLTVKVVVVVTGPTGFSTGGVSLTTGGVSLTIGGTTTGAGVVGVVTGVVLGAVVGVGATAVGTLGATKTQKISWTFTVLPPPCFLTVSAFLT
jgi:hypothetical protein